MINKVEAAEGVGGVREGEGERELVVSEWEEELSSSATNYKIYID